jgi:hypothetical protein
VFSFSNLLIDLPRCTVNANLSPQFLPIDVGTDTSIHIKYVGRE